jgi:hypothetical protein
MIMGLPWLKTLALPAHLVLVVVLVLVRFAIKVEDEDESPAGLACGSVILAKPTVLDKTECAHGGMHSGAGH